MIHVEVTAEDIAKGKPQSWHSCPVALALTRTNGKSWDVSDIHAACWEADIRVKLPVIAQGFIHTFDAGKPVQPFSFEVEIDDV